MKKLPSAALSILLPSVAALAFSCSGSKPRVTAPSNADAPLIRSEYAPGELTRLCNASIERAQKRFDEIGKTPAGTQDIDKTLLALDDANSDLSDDTSSLTFMKSVSTNEAISKESSECDEKVSQFMVGVSTRKDLYLAIKDQKPRNANEKRLLSETIKQFEISGLKLSDQKLAQVKELKTRLSTLQSQFDTNLNADTSTVTFTAAEMDGAPATFLARLKKDAQGGIIVTTKAPDYVEFMQNVKSSDARKRMAVAYNQRAAAKNIPVLEEAIQLRQKIAKIMGFPTWADYRLQDHMALNAKTVTSFLKGLRQKLAKRNKADLAKLLAYKKELDPKAKDVDSWDVPYLEYQLKKRDYSLDNEEIRKYFPADVAVQSMFDVYSQILGVKFNEVVGAPVWAEGVKQYEIRDAKSNQIVAYFYTDFFPRPLKYGHAAAFPLIVGRMKGGVYQKPVAAIVSNFSPSGPGLPPLLTHEDVETMFHEFGHIMHNTLTRAPYGSLSGTSVPTDFVEAPSQMLENWVWNADMLKKISGYYLDHSKKLPDSLIAQIIKARQFNRGYFYTRQLLFGFLDMTYHTSHSKVDAVAVFNQLYREIQGIDPVPGNKFPATFGHLMGGYDAGYYGYLWSEVYAQDMFTQFEKAGLTSPEIGARYRQIILEKGNMEPSMDLLKEFLGRKPNSNAFFKELGIKS